MGFGVAIGSSLPFSPKMFSFSVVIMNDFYTVLSIALSMKTDGEHWLDT